MANGAYFRFSDDNKIKYTYSQKHDKRNGSAENAHPNLLQKK